MTYGTGMGRYYRPARRLFPLRITLMLVFEIPRRRAIICCDTPLLGRADHLRGVLMTKLSRKSVLITAFYRSSGPVSAYRRRYTDRGARRQPNLAVLEGDA